MTPGTSILQVLQASSTQDLTTVATVKAELDETDGKNDTNIARWIHEVSAGIASYCNRVFALETVRERFFPAHDRWPQEVIGGYQILQLKRWPLVLSAANMAIAPPAQPLLSTVAGGSLGARTYHVTVTYVSPLGETLVSREARLDLTAGSLLQVASPAQDASAQATGWNVYVSLLAGAETRQNGTAALAIGTAFVEPVTGLVAGAAMQSPSVIEGENSLVRDVDYIVDTEIGQLFRLDHHHGGSRRWMRPVTVEYQAGYQLVATLPFDIERAAIELVKRTFFASDRDPMLRQENIEGVWSATYWFASGPGASGNMPPDIAGWLSNYRVPVIG